MRATVCGLMCLAGRALGQGQGNSGGGGGGGGGTGGGPQASGGDAYNLEVEMYIFGEESTVAYGGTCADACAAADLGDTADSSADCPTGCTYVAYVAPAAAVPGSCSDSAGTTEAECNALNTPATCVETADPSVAADLASCNAVSALDDASACEAVMLDCASTAPGSCAAGCTDDGATCSGTSTVPACTYSPAVTGVTWAAEVPAVTEVLESCTQTTTVDCSVQEVDCPNGVCDATGCTNAGACVFAPDNMVVPAKAVKYNVRSSQWPFCGPNNFLAVTVDMTEGSGDSDDGATCTAADCADVDACTEAETAAQSACVDAGTASESACTAVAGCSYTPAPAPVDASTCTGADLTNTDPNSTEDVPSPELCPDGCSYSHAVADDGTGTVTETCSDATGDQSLGSVDGLQVTFKGRSPNVDVCSTGADASCLNIKFGKIEERGPDATRKVNAHSIMSLASRNNLPTWTTGTMSYGSSSAVTFVKMALDSEFSRSCNANRDGGAADPNARPRPNRRATAVNMGGMVAQMPTKAMIAAPAAADGTPAPSVATNITVTTSNKGVEFMFPAFAEMYYDPIVAPESSFDACTSCADVEAEEVAATGGTGDGTGDSSTPAPTPASSTPAPATSSSTTVVPLVTFVAVLAAAWS